MIYCLLCFNTLGKDFSFVAGSDMISGPVNITLPKTLGLQIVNDLDPGEVENFVLVLASPQLIASGKTLEVLIANSLTVDIVDSDGR